MPVSTGVVLEVPLGPPRLIGAGLAGMHSSTALPHDERLAMMRAGELGSVHSWELVTAVDGPGTRMTVFLNGCPLRCLYCQNPDTLRMRDGEPVTADELIARIAHYRPVFDATGGGLTLSGGEVLMQPAFAARILRGATELGVHTAIDTSGFLGSHLSDAALSDTDLVLLDVKSGDEESYHHLTTGRLEPTLEFGRRLALEGRVEVWIRFVLVPGLTDGRDGVDRVAQYVASLNELRPGTVSRVEVLPFHQMGRDKWHLLGRPYALENTPPPSEELIERVREQFRQRLLLTF
ncbi:MAG: pyruvate formate-lyase-activating protein [Actinomycetota bacterium]|nr:pyruvate formate-lyase-activating protein [Actinomycetota bacterium]